MSDLTGYDGAVALVNQAHSQHQSWSTELLNYSVARIEQLSDFTATPIDFNIDFNFVNNLPAIQRPERPNLDVGSLEVTAPPAPPPVSAFDPRNISFEAVPTNDPPAPSFTPPPKPDAITLTAPEPPQRPAILATPPEPTYETPPEVTLYSLSLPEFPSLNLNFVAPVRPDSPPDFSIEPRDYDFSPDAYVSALLEKIKTRLAIWADGQEALPAAIERAIYSRGRARVLQEAAAEYGAIDDDFAARGFASPPGMWAARRDGATQAAQNRLAEFNRETTIKSFDETLANMRFGVQYGIQCEGMLINLHLEFQRLILSSLMTMRDTEIAVVNARIAQFNAMMQGYQIDAQVTEILLRAELAKLEELRAKIEIERIKGQLNETLVRMYAAQWDAVKSLADFYRTRVEAVKVQGELQRLPIEIYAQEVRAFESLVAAKASEWTGYRAGMEGETAKANMYRAQTEAFQARVQGVTAGNAGLIEQERLRIQQHGQRIEVLRANIARGGQLLDAERARLAAVGQKIGAQTDLYRTDAAVESAMNDANLRSFQQGLEKAKANVAAQVEEARIRSSENAQIEGLRIEVLKAIATIVSQLAASSMSAVNYSAGINASQGVSLSRSVSWHGEAGEWNSTFV